MKQYKFKQIKRKDGSEYFYKKLFHRNLVSQNVRGNLVRPTIKKVSETSPKKWNDTSERINEQIEMKKMSFFTSGSAQRLREDQECVNLLSQCSKALYQFRKRSEALLNREETID